jgi:hypothetical protein
MTSNDPMAFGTCGELTMRPRATSSATMARIREEGFARSLRVSAGCTSTRSLRDRYIATNPVSCAYLLATSIAAASFRPERRIDDGVTNRNPRRAHCPRTPPPRTSDTPDSE